MIKMNEVLKLVPANCPVEYGVNEHRYHAELAWFEQELNTGTVIGWHEEWDHFVAAVPVHEWLCTDTMVGVYAYYFRGEFVCLSFQMARKGNIEFRWKNKAVAQTVREFIRGLDVGSLLDFIDPEEMIAADWLTFGLPE